MPSETAWFSYEDRLADGADGRARGEGGEGSVTRPFRRASTVKRNRRFRSSGCLHACRGTVSRERIIYLLKRLPTRIPSLIFRRQTEVKADVRRTPSAATIAAPSSSPTSQTRARTDERNGSGCRTSTVEEGEEEREEGRVQFPMSYRPNSRAQAESCPREG